MKPQYNINPHFKNGRPVPSDKAAKAPPPYPPGDKK